MNPYLIFAFWAGVAIAPKAKAALYANGTTSQQTLDFGAQFAGKALSFRILVPGVGTGQRNTSASFLNSRYAITSAHNVTDLLQYNPTYEVADGPNYLTNRGNVMAVSSVLIHPTQDIAILEFASPYHADENIMIGSALTGDLTVSAGFGQWGTPALGLSRDGGLRAWNARVSDIVAVGDPLYYQSTSFGSDNYGLSFNGRAASGDSGGPVFNQVGELVGLNTQATVGTEYSGTTTFLKLSEPSLKAWIEANTALPLPTLTIAPVGSSMHLTWGTAATGFRLQTSEDLTSWSNLGDILTGSGTFDNPIGGRFQRFYRLAKTP